MEKREPSYTVGGNVNWYSHYGEKYVDSLKTKTELSYHPAIPLLGIYPEEKLGPQRYMHLNVHCSIVYNSQDMEAT